MQPDEFLPTPLRLRREIEQLTEVVGEFRSEAEIREVAGDINRRIVEWRRIPVGPPIHVRLVNADDLVARWRAAQSARAAAARRPAGGPAAGRPDSRRPGRAGVATAPGVAGGHHPAAALVAQAPPGVLSRRRRPPRHRHRHRHAGG